MLKENMGLSKEAIQELKRIYHRELGKSLSDDAAREMGERLLSLFKIIYRPIPEGRKREPDSEARSPVDPADARCHH